MLSCYDKVIGLIGCPARAGDQSCARSNINRLTPNSSCLEVLKVRLSAKEFLTQAHPEPMNPLNPKP